MKKTKKRTWLKSVTCQFYWSSGLRHRLHGPGWFYLLFIGIMLLAFARQPEKILLAAGLMFLLAAIPDMIQQTRRCRGENITRLGWWTFWSFGMAFLAMAALAAVWWMGRDETVGNCAVLGAFSVLLSAMNFSDHHREDKIDRGETVRRPVGQNPDGTVNLKVLSIFLLLICLFSGAIWWFFRTSMRDPGKALLICIGSGVVFLLVSLERLRRWLYRNEEK